MQRIWNRAFRDVFGYDHRGPLETKDLIEKEKLQREKNQENSCSCKLCRQGKEYRRQRQEEQDKIQRKETQEYFQENQEWICICKLCRKSPGRICDENWPRKMIGQWKDDRHYPDITHNFEELVKRKRAEERESWIKKEGPMSRCDSCRTVPDNRLKTCSRCKLVLYCKSFCQRGDWPVHKLRCKKA